MRLIIGRLWRRKLVRRSAYFLAAALALSFAATSSEPWAGPPQAPSAEQASAAHAGLSALRASQSGDERAGSVTLNREQLAAISALASHGLRPHRLSVWVDDGKLQVSASRRLPLGRWLNLRASLVGESSGFPSPRLSVGSVALPSCLGRYPFELARWVLILRGTDLPPLDEMVRAVEVKDLAITATLRLPRKTGLVDSLAGFGHGPIRAAAVARAYCGLAAMQRAKPQADFAAQVRRAFAFDPDSASPGQNGAALIGLAMLVGDERAGYLAGVEPQQVRSCYVPPPTVTLHGRADLPKHWALSAAIAAAQGTQLARSVGEWKELGDSLAQREEFAAGDPSGFSFVDLAADRAGFRTAEEAMSPGTASETAARLATVNPDQLLPPALIEEPEGLMAGEFERRFGGIESERYEAAVVSIDKVLTTRW